MKKVQRKYHVKANCRVNLNEDGVHISLDRQGDEKRHVAFHIHHQLFAGILNSIADQLGRKHPLPELERERLDQFTF